MPEFPIYVFDLCFNTGWNWVCILLSCANSTLNLVQIDSTRYQVDCGYAKLTVKPN